VDRVKHGTERRGFTQIVGDGFARSLRVPAGRALAHENYRFEVSGLGEFTPHRSGIAPTSGLSLTRMLFAFKANVS
jgi:hypothetical protein